ncbi:phage minor capsid protein [Schleiferilactobacillus perolens]|jgi:hypothetical protein|uniref:phage minor capsid protein n=1 Tax=Schleiferilactobacillus perolens TaxID=100468 RepID=UPI0023538875|nr:phage minor capsid protein [Schleiferilactobacillus perolens]MCI2170676.1 phage minor capsid protein [Schleiferilactobacillus perolens]
MAKPKVTPHQLTLQQAVIGDIYGHLEQELFEMFVDRLKSKGVNDLDETHVLQWQLEKLNELHLVNIDTIKAVAKTTGIAKKQLEDLITKAGYDVASDEYKRIGDAIGYEKSPNNVVEQALDGYLKQTFLSLDNNVNQTLITTNLGQGTATKTFQNIVRDIASEVITGIKTPERALQDTIYKWRQSGIPSGFVDKGGHKWSIDTYVRTVIDTTSARAFQAVRDEAANDYGIDTFVMSAHPASRAACAPIQGRTVTTRPQSFDDSQTGEHFEALAAHGYGKPGGTFGINCHHIKWAYIPGVNENTQPQYDPQEAIAKGNIQQQQRALERRVRQYKNELALAQKMGDQKGIDHYSQLIRDNQSALRQLIKQHDFLSRDYSREQVYSSNVTQQKPVKREPNKTEFKSAVKDSDITNAFEKTNIKEAFGDEYYSQFKSSISNLKDEQLRKLYANYGQDLDFANVSKTGGSYASTSTVHLNNSAFEGSDISEPMETVYHEIGHAIDSASMNDVFGKQLIPTGRQIKRRLAGKMYKFDEQASHLSADPAIDLGKTIKQDLFDYINHGEAKSPMQIGKKPRKKAEKAIWMEEDSKSWEGVEKIRQFIRDTKPTALENLRKYSNVSDMIEGTSYDVFDYPWNAGHGSKYWKDYGKEETEFFAEYTSSRAANPASLALIKEIFPNATKICDSLIDKMVEAKK